jgi:hypothetical protein
MKKITLLILQNLGALTPKIILVQAKRHLILLQRFMATVVSRKMIRAIMTRFTRALKSHNRSLFPQFSQENGNSGDQHIRKFFHLKMIFQRPLTLKLKLRMSKQNNLQLLSKSKLFKWILDSV